MVECILVKQNKIFGYDKIRYFMIRTFNKFIRRLISTFQFD